MRGWSRTAAIWRAAVCEGASKAWNLPIEGLCEKAADRSEKTDFFWGLKKHDFMSR